MKFTLILIGKTDFDWVSQGVDMYKKRLIHNIDFGIKLIPDVKNRKNMSIAVLKEKEGEQILSVVENNDFVVLLDERGKDFSSTAFAEFINKKMLDSTKSLVFVIGGAYGFSEQVYARANQKISLSKMTFSHQIVRLIFMEQIYRAFTIIRGEPYHHE